MKIFELAASEISTGYYDPTEDKLGARKLTDVRKEKLTLKHLNRLKKMRALQELEGLKRQDILGMMYGDSGGEENPSF